MLFARTAAIALAASALACPCFAQTAVYPTKPVRVLIPFPAGGDTEAALRVATHHLGRAFGQSFVIEPRPGGNTAIAAEAVAKSAPDGHTLFFAGPSTFTTNPALYTGLPYEYARDFAPVATLSSSPYFIVVPSSLAAKSLKDLFALARAEPMKYSYASIGAGSTMHLAYEMLARSAGVRMLHVPYKGLQYALPDVLSGRVTTLMSGLAIAGQQAKAGKLRVLAVSSASRSSLMPEVPTVAESGVPGYEIVAWFALYAPAKTPAGAISRLSGELRSFLSTQDARDAYLNLGQEVLIKTPAELDALVKSEADKFAKLIREANIKAE